MHASHLSRGCHACLSPLQGLVGVDDLPLGRDRGGAASRSPQPQVHLTGGQRDSRRSSLRVSALIRDSLALTQGHAEVRGLRAGMKRGQGGHVSDV